MILSTMTTMFLYLMSMAVIMSGLMWTALQFARLCEKVADFFTK